LKKSLVASILLLISGCQYTTENIEFQAIGFHTGYTNGALRGDDLHSVPFRIEAHTRVNKILGLPYKYGDLQVNAEVVVDTITSPSLGVLAGLVPMVRYNYPSLYRSNTTFFIRGGAGPGYFDTMTHEQGNPGFNFIDQIGAGIEHRLNDFSRLSLSYNFTHISHAGIRPTTNRGIEYHSIMAGIVIEFP
jgi:hypothetical protein